jgi:predicted nucleic acid-binding protein
MKIKFTVISILQTLAKHCRNLCKYPMQINEITHGMPTFQAQLKVNGSTVTTRLQAANIQQARALLVHLYGAPNVVSLAAVA